jgi:uncharacterized caspase-like protein
MVSWARRRVIKAALAAGATGLWPMPAAFAQSRAGLLRAPRQALVIGNSKYAQAPLKNPVNDARSIADSLKSTGFNVTVGLDFTQAQIRDAIRAHIDSLAKSKAVGLFYFAGHGAQLAWRNYLIPVGTEIVNVDQLRERGVDVNSLLEGIKLAGNPMNLIILDACRDNPFGTSSRLDQKGLSQVDAPPGTLLAYATAPGNTASDGDGANGLYTEHLLREINVPDAKVEDMFKRVRLGVRRRSNARAEKAGGGGSRARIQAGAIAVGAHPKLDRPGPIRGLFETPSERTLLRARTIEARSRARQAG